MCNGILRSGTLVLLSVIPPAGNVLAQEVQLGGTVYGVVRDEMGRPVKGAAVTYNRIPEFRVEEGGDGLAKVRVAAEEPLVNSQVLTAEDGTFEVKAIPSGDYVLCADKEEFVNACRWYGVHTVKVAAGSFLDVGEFRLVAAGQVRICVRDTGRLVRLATDRRIGGQDPIVGVMTKEGAFHPADVERAGDGKAEFSVRVPFEQDLALWIWSSGITMRMAAGVSLENGGSDQRFRVTTKAPVKTFEIETVGRSLE